MRERVIIWLMTDIPAFVREPMMSDPDAYISAVGFWWKLRLGGRSTKTF
jgi:hypothetical protein